jgi:hypothetical protein
VPEPHRPTDYITYRDAARDIFAGRPDSNVLDAFGLTELFAVDDPGADLTPAYALLEAQGYTGAVTPALARVGLQGQLPAGDPSLLGIPLGATRLVGVPALTPGVTVVLDRPGTGLVACANPTAAVRRPPEPHADPYLTVLDPDRAVTTTLVAEDDLNGRRASMLARTQLGAAAEILGIVDRLLDDAVAYARQRHQFGHAIASYQAIQHMLAWAATDRHQLTSLLDIAVAGSAHRPPDPELARTVKAMAGRVLHSTAQTAIQVTGAISFTWEYSLNRLHHRGLVLDQLAGASADLIAAIGRQVRTEGVVPELVDLCERAESAP